MATTKTPKISQAVAKQLADEAWKIITSQNAKLAASVPAQVRKSKAGKELAKLYKQLNTLELKVRKAEHRLEESYRITIYKTGAKMDVHYRAPRPDTKKLYREILTANQIYGVPAVKLLDHVVKKFSNGNIN